MVTVVFYTTVVFLVVLVVELDEVSLVVVLVPLVFVPLVAVVLVELTVTFTWTMVVLVQSHTNVEILDVLLVTLTQTHETALVSLHGLGFVTLGVVLLLVELPWVPLLVELP